MTKKEIKRMRETYAEAYGVDVEDINIEYNETNEDITIQINIKPPTPVKFINIGFKILPDGEDFTA